MHGYYFTSPTLTCSRLRNLDERNIIQRHLGVHFQSIGSLKMSVLGENNDSFLYKLKSSSTLPLVSQSCRPRRPQQRRLDRFRALHDRWVSKHKVGCTFEGTGSLESAALDDSKDESLLVKVFSTFQYRMLIVSLNINQRQPQLSRNCASFTLSCTQ